MKSKADFIGNSLDWIPATLEQARVAVWGLGLMGGSLALALHGKTSALYGLDSDARVCAQAGELQIFDRLGADPAEILPQANLIILAAPLKVLPALLEMLPQIHPGQAVVMDLGSTKTDILSTMELLPQRFAPLGGHPMCGKEVNTLSQASPSLYEGAGFALLPLPRTPQPAVDLAVQMVEAVGSHPVWLDPITHDQWAASISHLPYLVSNCLAGTTPLAAAPLVGPGYLSATRLAGESIDMMIDILMNNRLNVLATLQTFRLQMDQIEASLQAGDFDSLRAQFEQGASRHSAVLDSFAKGKSS